MSLEHILLGMLHRPASGYDLKRDFDQGGRHVWSAELSQIYPTLQSLLRRGWLKSRTVPSTKGPPRRVYQRTTKGDRVLHRWLSGGPILGTERFAYIAQLLFLGELNNLEQTLSFLQQLRDKLASHVSFLQSVDESIKPRSTSAVTQLDPVAFHEWISVRFGVTSLQAKVAWCEEAIRLVKERLKREKPHV